MVPNQRKLNKRKPQKAKPKHKSAGSAIRSTAQMVGHAVAGPLGGRIGYMAGDFFSRITGLGAYKISKNALMDVRTGVPHVGSVRNDGSMVFSHNEYITDVSSSVAFTSTVYQVNPGLSTLFPYLSKLASQFEFYEFEGLVFYFRSTSATAVSSTNTALGTLIMAAEYNVNAAAFTSKQQMETTKYCVSGPPCADLMFPVECDPKQLDRLNYLVRTGTVGSAPLTDYDLCNFTIATQGMQAVSTIGELWVCAQLRVRNPILTATTAILPSSLKVTGVSGSTANTWGTTPTLTQTGTAFCTLSGETFTFNRTGVYLLSMGLFGGTIAQLSETGTVTQDIIWANSSCANSTASVVFKTRQITVTAVGQTYTYSSSFASWTSANCVVSVLA